MGKPAPAGMQCATWVTECGSPASGVNPGVLIQPPAHAMVSLGGNYAFASKTGGPDAHNPVTEPSCVAKKTAMQQRLPSPGPPCYRRWPCALARLGWWLWAGRRAFLGGSDGVEPSGTDFILRQLKKEEGQLLFLS